MTAFLALWTFYLKDEKTTCCIHSELSVENSRKMLFATSGVIG
jgi:hypothetical protein